MQSYTIAEEKRYGVVALQDKIYSYKFNDKHSVTSFFFSGSQTCWNCSGIGISIMSSSSVAPGTSTFISLLLEVITDAVTLSLLKKI